jgi:hypothetical protein
MKRKEIITTNTILVEDFKVYMPLKLVPQNIEMMVVLEMETWFL